MKVPFKILSSRARELLGLVSFKNTQHVTSHRPRSSYAGAALQ